MERLLKKEK